MKKWLIAAAVLVLVGAVIFVSALAAAGFDFTKLNTQKFTTKNYEFGENFESIFVNVETADVTFVPTDESVCKVVCFEEEKRPHSVEIKNGTLNISYVNNHKWNINIGIYFSAPKITVYLPKAAYKSLSVATKTGGVEVPEGLAFETVGITGATADIECRASVSKSIEIGTATGKITLGEASAETVKLSAETGKITAQNVACKRFSAKNGTGKIILENVIAEERIDAETGTGDIRFNACDAAEITAETGTGSVKGTLLSEKIFITKTSTGKVSVPSTASGGRCEITTGTGDIKIEIGG